MPNAKEGTTEEVPTEMTGRLGTIYLVVTVSEVTAGKIPSEVANIDSARDVTNIVTCEPPP